MNQALHIFHKDVIRLWPQIAITLFSAATYAVVSSRPENPLHLTLVDLLSVTFPAAYVWLIERLVHQEPLPGDRQFWLTRPYSRGSLLAAKSLFILLFVTLPILAKDCYIVNAWGFSISPLAGGLLLRQFAWMAWLTVSAFAIAAVTRTLQEFALCATGVGLLTILQTLLFRGSAYAELVWLRIGASVILLFAFCGAILRWQYHHRQTTKARIALALCAVLATLGIRALSDNALFSVQAGLRSPQNGQSQPTLYPQDNNPVQGLRLFFPHIKLAVKILGLKPGTTLVADGARVFARPKSSGIWDTGWNYSFRSETSTQALSVLVPVTEAQYRSLTKGPATLKLSIALSVLNQESSTPIDLQNNAFRAESLHCGFGSRGLYCTEAVRRLSNYHLQPEKLNVPTGQSITSYEPYPLILGESPVTTWTPSTDTVNSRKITLAPLRPIAHIRREVEFHNVSMSPYVEDPQ